MSLVELVVWATGYALIGDAIGRFKLNVWLLRYRHEFLRFLAFPISTANQRWKQEEAWRENPFLPRPEIGLRPLGLVADLEPDLDHYKPKNPANKSLYVVSNWLLWPGSFVLTSCALLLLLLASTPVVLEQLIARLYRVPSKAVDKLQQNIEERRALAAKVRVATAELSERTRLESELVEEVEHAEKALKASKDKLEELRSRKTYRE